MNHHTHIYLYAKGHYKKTNVIDDMKILISEYSGIDKKYVLVSDIIDILIGLAYKHINESGNPEYFFKEFVHRILYSSDNEEMDKNIQETTIKSCLSAIKFCKVKNLGLGDPDFSILPKREE